jgi:hypothetical protein
MKFSKFIVIPIIIAILAAVMQVIDQLLAANTIVGSLLAGGGSWIAFQAWAVYFLGGCNVRGGVKGFLAYVVGIIASIAIMVLGGSLGGFMGVPIAILILVVPCICCERVDILSYVPALFVGAGAYFGIMGYIAPTVVAPYTGNFVAFGLVELFYCLFGLLWGYITVKLRTAYEAKVKGEA